MAWDKLPVSSPAGMLQDWAKAIEDADACIRIKPDWGKGYGRKGAALHGMGDLEAAHKTYQQGLQVEPGVSRCRGAGMSAGLSWHEALLPRSVEAKRALTPACCSNPCAGLAMLTKGLQEVEAQIKAEASSGGLGQIGKLLQRPDLLDIMGRHPQVLRGCEASPAPRTPHPAPRTPHPAPRTRGLRARAPPAPLAAKPLAALPRLALAARPPPPCRAWHS